jgi:carboxylesterase type B
VSFADDVTADVPLVFGTHYQFRQNSTELEWKTSHAMQEAWVSFATDSTSDLTFGEGIKWPRYSLTSDIALVFGGNNTAARLSQGSYADSFTLCT